ncbi:MULTISPECIES: MFS transporter [unclassified Leifsonia]|uniref:MFS transporter n=1 Tax=unclassified Leifsonia TaxID=2663824 RepID=UPI0006F6B6DE|nr:MULTISPECIES: MFS transporter [unclassified Leifsonia]KQX07679.1 transporter [Leifsonia sp. Root1293]KRA11961.1 transporter [Leifsonia sp. Root60]
MRVVPDRDISRSRDPGTVRDAAGGIVALTIATFFAITTEMLPVGVLPAMGRDLGVTESIAGLLVTVYAFMVAALAVPLTLWTRRMPRKMLLIGTLAAYVAGNLVVALAPSFAVVAAGRALGGVAHALFFSLSIAYGSRLVRPEYTGRALALVTAGASAGFVLGVPLSTALGTAVGWRVAFGVLAVGCLVALILVILLLPAVSIAPAADRDDPERRTRRGRLAAVSVTNALVYLGQYTVYTYVAVILLAAGLSAAGIGPVLLVLGGLGLLGTWYAGITLDRRPRSSLIVVLVAMAVGLVALGLAFPSLIGVLAATALWGAGFGAVASSFQTAAIRTRGATPDIIGALVNTTANLGIGGGAALGAVVLASAGIEWLPYLGAALVVAGVVVVWVARRAFPPAPDHG